MLAAAGAAPGADGHGEQNEWPQFLGPHRSGEYRGPPLASSWPEKGPRLLWKRPTGEGHSAPSVSGGQLVLFHRIGNEERIECLRAEDGEALWALAYPTRYSGSLDGDNGPRATPTVAAGRVYCYGAEGVLTCAGLEKGDLVWRSRTHEVYHPPESYFGAACSPLVDGGKVFVNVGGQEKRRPAQGGEPRGSGIVAFDAETGKELWTATSGEASYSSPVAADFGGERLLVFFTRTGVAVLDPDDGAVRFEKRWRARIQASVNAATPLAVGDHVFVTASYATGALLLRHRGGGSFEEVWSGDESLSSHYATPVHRGGFLYGFHGRQEAGAPLVCVELATGKVSWSEPNPGAARYGAGTLILAGDKLVVLTDAGELVLAEASSERFRALARARVLGSEVRAHAALAAGKLYARDKTTLVCVDLARP